MRSARRTRHHLLIAAALLPAAWLVDLLYDREGLRERLSVGTAYLGFGLIALSLLLGPLNLLRGRPNPVSTDLRRDVGIWGGCIGILHIALGLGVHMQGRWLEYFMKPAGSRGLMPLRFDPFGIANHLGLLAGLILVLLVSISSDAALRALGTVRWKTWQRANYVGAAATVLHGIIYQLAEKRTLPLVALFAMLIVSVLVAQGLGVRAAPSPP